jgi:exodeoxyribonuclease-3
MKFISFNINSLRARLHQVEALIARHQPDVIGLQETKVQDQDFPLQALLDMGYHAEYFGQKTHYGVALLSKQKGRQVLKGMPSEAPDAQRRFIAFDYPTSSGGCVHVINGYFPQGEERKHPTKFPYKQEFYRQLIAYLKARDPNVPVIVMGDMNIAPLDADIGIGEKNAKRWLQTGKCSFLPEERDMMHALIQTGLSDTFRHLHPTQTDQLSWFDYRSKGFEDTPRRGLRIDLILASQSLMPQVKAAGIDLEVRAMEKPSDHAPVWVELDL